VTTSPPPRRTVRAVGHHANEEDGAMTMAGSPTSATGRGGAARTGFGRVLLAEWTKLRTVRSTAWALLAVAALTVALSAFVCSALDTDAGAQSDNDSVMPSVAGVYLSQIAVVALAVLAITGEYATGMIRTTFLATPGRGRVLAAKAVVLGSATLVVGVAASVASFLVGQPILAGNGFVATPLGDPAALRSVLGSGLYLAVLALFGLGAGAILRRPAGAVSAVLGLLFGPLIVAMFLPGELQRLALDYGPMTAGLAIQMTKPTGIIVGTVPVAPWTGFAVFSAYTAVTMAAAFWLIGRGDA
jgi:ABC-2 type transport system permease protein